MHTALDEILIEPNARMRLNEALASRGETHRSTVESWSALRCVAQAVRRTGAILAEVYADVECE